MPTKKNISITVRLTPDEWEIVDSLRPALGDSMSAVIRRLINENDYGIQI